MSSMQCEFKPITDRSQLNDLLEKDQVTQQNIDLVRKHFPKVPIDIWYKIISEIFPYQIGVGPLDDAYKWFRWWCSNKLQQKLNPLYSTDNHYGLHVLVRMSGGTLLMMLFDESIQSCGVYPSLNYCNGKPLTIEREGDFLMGLEIPKDVLPKIKKIELCLKNRDNLNFQSIPDFFQNFQQTFELELDPSKCVEILFSQQNYKHQDFNKNDFTETKYVHLFKVIGPIPLIACQYIDCSINVTLHNPLDDFAVNLVYTFCSSNVRRSLAQLPHEIIKDKVYITGGFVTPEPF